MRKRLTASFVASIALAACSQPPETTTAAQAANAAAAEEAVNCMTWLSLQVSAIEGGHAQGDAPVLNTAFESWRTRAGTLMPATELAQYFASNVAVLDDAAPADIASNAETCRASAPQ